MMSPSPPPRQSRASRVVAMVVLFGLPVGRAFGSLQHSADPPATASRFEITPGARLALRALWRESLAARVERVACLGGRESGGRWVLDRVGTPDSAGGDSLGVSALPSVRRCGPPEWVGTVHTHIALREGARPYANFSGADRAVMLLWWSEWKARGVFCVLYTDRDAHCEVDGLVAAGADTHAEY